ncbi:MULTISPECIES: metalloregulator ArsR/SmtB family transcription factor [unclassified Bacillus (in: firmicutes)]|uniref:helix-turn-helix transcriptional regulator n=1 Tax=unclassified Bacillus (in: firmicutes) TaxID=185979 RepID=UPI0008F2D1C2|nr:MULTISPECIES: ArsR family transcriptional regulator [unclassified Bacillus (in: firmicutes)]SFJ76103.1 Predicted transcriptional regulator, ArsR family [Bacillus sp. 71mf]SFT16743.1 Predicted transcriptional regulator, ArsR family [Bacillus sp. 103mf]
MGEAARSTREEIIQLLKVRGEQTVSLLAEALQITEMAVRRHLSKLEKDKLIEMKMVRQHVGRPMYVYCLSAKGEDLFPKQYKQFAVEMLEDLQRIGDEELVKKLLQARTDRMEEQLAKRVNRKETTLERLKEIAIMQEKNGYMVRVEQESEHSFILQKQNCPLMEVAEKFPQICHDEKSMYNKLLPTADVKVLSSMCAGDCFCSYQIIEKK